MRRFETGESVIHEIHGVGVVKLCFSTFFEVEFSHSILKIPFYELSKVV